MVENAEKIERFKALMHARGDLPSKQTLFALEASVGYGKRSLNYLFLSNAGGLLSVSTIIAQSRDQADFLYLQISIALFLIGLLFATLSTFLAYINWMVMSEYYEDLYSYFTRNLEKESFSFEGMTLFNEPNINESHKKMKKWSSITFLLPISGGVLSFLLFGSGIFFLVKSLIDL